MTNRCNDLHPFSFSFVIHPECMYPFDTRKQKPSKCKLELDVLTANVKNKHKKISLQSNITSHSFSCLHSEISTCIFHSYIVINIYFHLFLIFLNFKCFSAEIYTECKKKHIMRDISVTIKLLFHSHPM